MTIFEINGTNIEGGKDDSHNQTLLNRVNVIEGFIQPIQQSLGMASLDSVFVKTEEDGFGFRFASTSDETFDSRGIHLDGCAAPSELVERIG